jgi:hypothetical protein
MYATLVLTTQLVNILRLLVYWKEFASSKSASKLIYSAVKFSHRMND